MKHAFRLAAVCIALLPASPAAAGSCVPVPAYGSPSVSGMMSGVPVTAIYDYSGGNGGAFGVEVYWLTAGGNGEATAHQKIGVLREGDRMTAFVSGGRLYVANAIYLPGEAHCCYTHLAVQRFSMNVTDREHPKLVATGTGTVAEPKAPSYGSCPDGQEGADYHAYFNGPWKSAVMSAVR